MVFLNKLLKIFILLVIKLKSVRTLKRLLSKLIHAGLYLQNLKVIIAIGALWGIFTLIGIREEDKDIQEMIDSARNAIRKSHGSE
jgi:hypothetical protein